MPAPSFLKGLPKPLLFACYGAVGGLLGAVLFGEPLWWVLRPPPPPPGLVVGASAVVKLYPGTENEFAVRIVRERFSGPVVVRFASSAEWVRLAPVMLPADTTDAVVRVSAPADVPPGRHPVTVTAEAETVTDKATGLALGATATLELEVVAPPPPPPAVALAVPTELVTYQQGLGRFVTLVARRHFDGPVKISVGPLPPGVTAEPAVVPAGSTQVEVTLKADETAPLGTTPLTVTAEAVGTAAKAKAPARLEVRKPLVIAPTDVVFVLDVTSSMQWAIDDLKNGIGKFADTLSRNQLNFRLGLVTFQDLTVPGEKVEVVRFRTGEREEPFTAEAMVFRDKLGQLRAAGGGDIPESSLEAVVEAAKLPYRQGATKVVLLLTDAPPKVRDVTVADAVRAVRDAGLDSVHLVVQRFDRDVYGPLAEAGTGKTPGKYFNLGDVVRGDEGFDGLLDTFGKAVAAAAKARDPDVRPEVAPPPKPPELPTAAVALPKSQSPPATLKSLQSAEGAAVGSEGRLVLQSGVWTGAVAALVCLALLAGQTHYLRGSLPRPGAVLVGFVGGLLVGFLGGAAGQGLYTVAQGGTLGTVFQVLGWALLGGLAGLGLSLFIPNMKSSLGLAGGVVGGAVGGIGFIALSAAAGDLVGRLVGGLLIGFCIGLVVVLVETAFRRAWLEVRFGSRETIRVNLGPEPVKVGGDAKTCTVWARGAPPVALRFFVRDGRVICDDPVMRREVMVADGFAKEVGNVTVTVRTGATPAAPAPPPVARPVTPPRPTPKSERLPLDDDFDPLPMPVSPPPAPPVPSAPVSGVKPPAPPALPKSAPPASHRPPVSPASSPPVSVPPVSVPKPSSTSPGGSSPSSPGAAVKHPDACPTCGRVNAGKPKQRYCMICDQMY